MRKKCTKCLIKKPLSNFHYQNKVKKYFSSWCKDCQAISHKKWYQQHLEEQKEYNKKYKTLHTKYYQSYMKLWRLKNPNKVKNQRKRWAQNNSLKIRENNSQYQNRKLKRIPRWADLEKIKEFYMNCPKGKVVDHIIPLRGKIVSGFHIVSNLQYLTKKQNLKKGNRFSD